MEDRGLYSTSLGITLVKRNTPFLARNCLSRLEFYRLESVRSLCFSGGGRRCRFRHAHPGATSGLCSLLGDLPPPPFPTKTRQKLLPPFGAGDAYLFGIFKRSVLSQDVLQVSLNVLGRTPMLKQEGKIGAIRRNVHGKACSGTRFPPLA